MKDTRKRSLVLLASTALAMTLGLVACAGNGGAPAASTEGEPAQAAVEDDGNASVGAESGEPYGSPWITSMVQDNLPAKKPSVKDDLYTYYNYDYLAANQTESAAYMSSTSGEVREAAVAALKDESRTDHEIEQMRILYDQAADTDTLAKTGFGEVQPYINMIDEVASIDQMNELLASNEFPFSPFLQAYVAIANTHGENVVGVEPNLVLSDAILSGGKYYQDSDDQSEQKVNDSMLAMGSASLVDAELIGFDINDQEAMDPLVAFEKSYAKYADYGDKWLSKEFGAQATDVAQGGFTLDELCALCPNFPMREILAKLRKDTSSLYVVPSHEWVGALNEAWTEDNLDVIKLAAKCKVLVETSPFRDQSARAAAYQIDDFDEAVAAGAVSEPETFAYDACNSADTFSQLIAKIYVEDVLGQEAKDRLMALTQDLIGTYKDLIANTAWLGEESDQKVTQKLDNLGLNILEPDDGYFDYGGLELVPTEEGGTLLSNYLRLKQYRYDCEAQLIGKPASQSVVFYELAPTMENAFYDPLSNSINIFPGFVTSAVYRNDMSDTQLIAGAGFVIGHEISHGFDYSGAQFDAYAQPNPIISDDDVQVFLAKCDQLADCYSAIEYKPGKFVNGRTVVSEAAADLSGLQAALVLAESKGADYEEFFGDFAQLWAQTEDDVTFSMTSTDVHPANNLRVNVNAQMFDPMYKVFDVAEGDGMYLAPNKRIVFWGEQA